MSNYSKSTYSTNNSSWHKALGIIPERSLVLDIGCSSGNFGAELIKQKHCTVDGVEINMKDADLATKNLRTVYRLNIEKDNLDEIKEKYGIIYFGDVIEHLVDPTGALKRVKGLLKPGGKVVFSIPNMAHATVRLLLLKGDFEHSETGLLDKTHLHFYNLDEIEKVFNEAGYTIDHIDFVKKDYPDSLIKKQLESLDLSAGSKFYELMRQPEAAAFQFVGSATADGHPRKLKRQKFGPIDLFESYYSDTVQNFEAKLATMREELAESQHAAAELKRELDNIYSSKGWAYLSKLRKLKRPFK